MDPTSKAILEELIKSRKGTEFVCAFDEALSGIADTSIERFSESLNLNTEDVRAAVRYLEGRGYLEYQSTSGGHNIGFHLSHKGLNWRDFRRKEILDYIADKWPDFIAVIISLMSLFISIAALTQGKQ